MKNTSESTIDTVNIHQPVIKTGKGLPTISNKMIDSSDPSGER